MARKPYTVQKAQEAEPMEMGFSLPITFFSSMEIAPDWDTSDRDAYLRSFWKRFGNDMVQAVLAACVAKIQTQNWEIEGPEGLVEMYHPILRDDANFGKGYGDMIARGVIDYYTQDNGWFMERQRSGPEDRSGPMLGIAHMDSARMRPTGNQDFPYTYNDVYGTYHLMHRSQFIRIVDMPDSRTELHGWDRGFCALSRALSTSIILMMLITLKREKLSDLPPSALAIFNNLNRKQFEKAITLYGAQEDMKANTIWRQLMPLFGIDPAHPATVQFLSLREVWESFDDMTAMNIAAYSFAAAWRVDPREFWPVSQGPLGTGKEAEVQHQKAKAKSTGLLFTEVERSFNARDSLPPGLTWKYVLQDADEEQQRALIHQMQIGNVKTMQEAGAGLIPDEVRWLLATQYKVLPQAMLKAPEEGGTFDLAHADVYLDDVERQAKEYNGWWFGPMVRMDQDGRKEIVNQIGYKLPSGVMFLGGEKSKVVDAILEPAETLDVDDAAKESLQVREPGDNGNLTFGSKELLEVSLKEQFPCCESHAFQLFPDIVHDLFLLNYLTLPQMCKASMAPSSWVYSVSQAIPPGQDTLEMAGKDIARALDAVDFELGDKEGKALQTINQKIASLPAPTARTVRDNAKRLQTSLGASTKRRLAALKGITDEEWAEAVAQDELADQLETGEKGGSGSGNWGHTGRPGLVGGSGGGAGVGTVATGRQEALDWFRNGIRVGGVSGVEASKDVPAKVSDKLMGWAERHDTRVLRAVGRVYVAKDKAAWVREHQSAFGYGDDPAHTSAWSQGDNIYLRPRGGPQSTFDHEVGHVAWAASGTTAVWRRQYTNPSFDRHTAYSKTSRNEAFAEAYMSYVASGGQAKSARYVATYAAVEEVLDGIR